MLRLFKKPIPEVFRDEVMNPIGASNTWQWIPYNNSYADVDGKKMPSVSGGTRWGGGVWINAQDMARFGYLWLRNGKWGSKQIIPPAYVKEALTPAGAKNSPDYGFLWWLNTKRRREDAAHQLVPGAGRRAATPSSSHPITTWSSCGAGTVAEKSSSSAR